MNYPGKELESFDKAHFWRNYAHFIIKKFIGKKIEATKFDSSVKKANCYGTTRIFSEKSRIFTYSQNRGPICALGAH